MPAEGEGWSSAVLPGRDAPLDVAPVPIRATRTRAHASGTLIAADEWLPLLPKRKGMPVLQKVMETPTRLLLFANAERLRDDLRKAGLDVTWEVPLPRRSRHCARGVGRLGRSSGV